MSQRPTLPHKFPAFKGVSYLVFGGEGGEMGNLSLFLTDHTT